MTSRGRRLRPLARIRGFGAALAAVIVSGCDTNAVPAPPSLALGEAILSVGGDPDDEDLMLSRVVGATFLDDGRLVVADRFTQGLRVFSLDMRLLAAVGGEGEGPEEYEHIRGIGPCEEGKVVAFDLDWSQKVYSLDLVFERESAVRIDELPRGPYQFACAPTGHFVATGWGDLRADFEEGFYTAHAPAMLAHGTRTVRDFGVRLSSERIGMVGPDGSASGSAPHPFGRHTSVAIGADRVYLGDGTEYAVEVYDLEGNALEPIQWTGPERDMSAADWEAYEEERVAAAPEDRRPALRQAIRDMPRVDRVPAYDRLLVDSADRLWVRLFRRPGADGVTWQIFDRDGNALGALALPDSVSLLEAGGEHVTLLNTDDATGVETVTVHPFSVSPVVTRRPPAGAERLAAATIP